MHSRSLAFTAVLLVLMIPFDAAAQDWDMPWYDPRDRPPRVDLNVAAGVMVPTDWSDLVLLGTLSSASGVFEQVIVRDLQVEADSVVSAALTYWQGRHGFRAHVGRSRSSLLVGGELTSSPVGVDTWFYDVRGAIGLLEYHPSLWVWPYVSVGFGGITYDLARPVSPPLLSFIDRGRAESRPDVLVVDGGHEFLIAIDELRTETVLALNLGVGTDIRIPLGPGGIGIRLELTDHIAHSPLRLQIQELSPFGGATTSVVRFGYVHHLRAAAGLIVQIGR